MRNLQLVSELVGMNEGYIFGLIKIPHLIQENIQSIFQTIYFITKNVYNRI